LGSITGEGMGVGNIKRHGDFALRKEEKGK
jgi:hypothetical protein